MINWKSWLIRAVIGFFALFLLAYLVPGLSAFTITHLLFVSLLLAFLSTTGENIVLADTIGKKSILLFAISALTIYFYAAVFMRERPPVVSILLAAALITVADYFIRARDEARANRGVSAEGNQEPPE